MHRESARAGCLVWCALLSLWSLAPQSTAHAQTERSTSDIPSHDDITDYFSAIRADLYTCPHGWHGPVDVEVTFTRDGRATNVEVEASEGTLPDAVRSCVASVVRGARIRAFSEPVAVVEYTFRL
jgi:hypothetical protein